MAKAIEELPNGHLYQMMMTDLGVFMENMGTMDTGELLLMICQKQHEQIKELQMKVDTLRMGSV